jgi:hypothetical protein
MKRMEQSTIKLPDQIKLLFNNEYLDAFTLLIILWALSGRKPGTPLRQLIFYCSIIVNEDLHDAGSLRSHRDISSNIYQKYNKKIKDLILRLHSLQLIQVEDKRDIACKITNEGIETVNSLESSYFSELRVKSTRLIKEVPFTSATEKEIIGGSDGKSNKNK